MANLREQIEVRRSVQRRDLQNVRTLITDSSRNSPNYFNFSQIGDELSLGKNAILVRGSENLQESAPILVEIIDSEGGTIYTEVPPYTEDVSRVISIYVYENTPPGPAIVTVLGEAKEDKRGEVVPEFWRGKYNLKWTRKLNVAPNIYNVNKVRFFQQPTAEIQRVPFKAPPSSFSSTSQVTESEEISVTLYPDHYGYQNLVVRSSSPFFNRFMRKGVLVISEAEVASSVKGPDPELGEDLKLRIETVLSSGRAYASVVTDSYDRFPEKVVLKNAQASISYERQNDPGTVSGTEDRDRIDISLEDLRTVSGSVLRAKIYEKDLTEEPSAYKQVDDLEIEPINLLVDKTSGRRIPTGFFKNATDVLNYLVPLPSSDVSAQLVRNNDVLLDSVKIENPNDSSYGFKLETDFGTSQITDLVAGSQYNLTFRAVHQEKSASDLEVYLTGDAFKGDEDDSGEILFETLSSPGKFQYFEFSQNFRPIRDGQFNIEFRVRTDGWYVTDIRLIPEQDEGFSPDFTELTFILDRAQKAEQQLKYRIDLFDLNNNKVPVLLETRNTTTIPSV